MCGGLHHRIDFPGPVSQDVGLTKDVPEAVSCRPRSRSRPQAIGTRGLEEYPRNTDVRQHSG